MGEKWGSSRGHLQTCPKKVDFGTKSPLCQSPVETSGDRHDATGRARHQSLDLEWSELQPVLLTRGRPLVQHLLEALLLAAPEEVLVHGRPHHLMAVIKVLEATKQQMTLVC